MTEEEFRARYKKSFLDAFTAAVNIDAEFTKVPGIAELLTTIDERATIAWKQYQKETKRDS